MKRGTIYVLVFLVCLPIEISGQYEARVRRVSAEVTGGLVFNVQVNQQQLRSGQNVVLTYFVENRGRHPIYLVRKRGEVDVAAKDNYRVMIQIPLPWPIEHGDYDYEFRKVESRGRTRGRIDIPARYFSEEHTWQIEVVFGYVTNITGLNRRPRRGEDPAKLRALLNSRVKILMLSPLTLNISEVGQSGEKTWGHL